MSEKMKKHPGLLVSACLLGCNCKYSGGNNYCADVSALSKNWTLHPVCPEVLGGLPTPRAPSERLGDRVVTNTGDDVTAQFHSGAAQALTVALENNCRIAVMKARSPSCGYGIIYDGTFTGITVSGNGVTAALLLQHDIRIYTEETLDEFSEHR